MPSYDYTCKKCGHRFELLRPLAKRDDPAPCPSCKSKSTTRKTINRLAVVRGVRPIAELGEGEAEDFLDGGDDDFGGGDHGHSHGPGGHSHTHGGDHGGVNNWDDEL